MRMKKFALASAAVVVAATGALTIAASPAQAAAENCPDKHVCMWEDDNYEGSQYVQYLTKTGTDSMYQYYDIDWWEGDNEISSFVNNTGCDLYISREDLNEDDDHNGKYFHWNSDDPKRSASLEPYGMDNDAESFNVYCNP